MSTAHTRDAVQKPLRLWPGVVLVIVQWVVRFVLPVVAPDATLFGWRPGLLPLFGGIFCGLAILLWWLFFSRANWSERVGALVLMIVGLAATSRLAHPSISGAVGGLLLFIYAIPVLSLALVAWAVASRHLSSGPRRASMVASILFACAVFTLLRSDGVIGVGAELHWRWTKTAEERLLAQSREPPPAAAEVPKDPLAASADKKPAPEASPTAKNPRVEGPAMSERGVARVEWPGFRGSERDGVIRGVRIKTDWSQSPPVELWRRPIGPGWSSFAVAGDLLYTQEQRGEEEIVSCYRVSTGKPVWRHRDAVRFSESNAGAGPRATPTLNSGLVYTLGATGILNALDASNGAVVWSRNAAKDTGREVPEWGFAGSPLVINDRVIIALYGQLVAYDARTGAPRWVGPPEGAGYSSPHLMTIDGVAQILLLRGSRTTSFAPVDGTVLWEHRGQLGVSIVQPALAAQGDVLIAAGDAADTVGGSGMRRIAVAHGPGGWTVEERWTSRGLKPYFNDFVVHKGHAFGFDGRILASIDLADGTRKWKGGRYGNGQLVLLADQDVLLVLSEEGELALVGATPDQFTELARFQAIEGKTWNHPALIGDVLLVRNDQEMAAFRLAVARSASEGGR